MQSHNKSTIQIQLFSDEQTNKISIVVFVAVFRWQFIDHFGWLCLVALSVPLIHEQRIVALVMLALVPRSIMRWRSDRNGQLKDRVGAG